MNRRTFFGVLGAGAFGWRAWAEELAKSSPIVLPSAFFGSVTPAEAGFNPEVTSQMSAYLQAQIAAGEIPGAFVAAMRHGKVFLEEHFGTYCNRTERTAPYDGAAIHPFHSISKMISATAVVMAWQDGLIDIDVPVAKYVPEFAQNGKQDITIRQLLTHSAGIPKTPTGIAAGTEEKWKAAVAAACAQPVEWPPGSKTEYHAITGMLIAAEAVRRMSGGKTWNTICRERIFEPLGLNSFTFEEPPLDLSLACIPRLANPPAQWQTQLNHFQGEPAAGLKGSFTDVLKFLAFQSHRGVWKGKALLQEKYWTEMHTPQFPIKPGFDSWGLGMMVRGTGWAGGMLGWFGLKEVTGPHIFGHVGTNIAMAVGDPDTDTQIVFMVTDAPKTQVKATELRDTVTATVFNALAKTT
jgi:serine-type D-Ala-D-Ala carboxypeptidase